MPEKKIITFGKAYVFTGQQWYGVQFQNQDHTRIVGTTKAYALGEMALIYTQLTGGHHIARRHSYPDPLVGYFAELAVHNLKAFGETDFTAIGNLLLANLQLFPFVIEEVDQLPQKESTASESWCGLDGPCTAH